MSIVNAAKELGAWEKIFIVGVLLVGLGMSVKGTWDTIQESPALLNQATSAALFAADTAIAVGVHVDQHHDTIVTNVQRLDILTELAVEIDGHLEQIDLSMTTYNSRQEYLICLREQRALEVADNPPTRNCADEFVLGRPGGD